MEKYGLGFKKCEDKDTAKGVVAKHGGKLYDSRQEYCYYCIYYLATEEQEAEIDKELISLGLLEDETPSEFK